MRFLIYISLFLSLSIKSYSQDIQLFITNDSIVIGDQFELWVQGFMPPEQFNWISQEKNLGSFEVIKWGDKNKRAESGSFEQRIVMQAWEDGQQWIPQMTFIIGQDSFLTDSILIPVHGIQIDSGEAQLRPIKGIINPPFDWREAVPYAIAFAVLLAVILLLLFLRKYFKKEPQEIIEPEKPAHEWALDALANIKKMPLDNEEQIKSFYIELSYTLRSYIERRYDILALEQTTKEIMNSALKKQLNNDNLNDLRQGLQTMDLVKFAKFTPDSDEHLKAWQKLYDFVNQTKLIENA